MKTAEIKSLLHERIEQLTASQLTQLNDILNEKFPKKRQLGTMPGLVKYMAPDFDEPLEDFNEYMPDQHPEK